MLFKNEVKRILKSFPIEFKQFVYNQVEFKLYYRLLAVVSIVKKLLNCVWQMAVFYFGCSNSYFQNVMFDMFDVFYRAEAIPKRCDLKQAAQNCQNYFNRTFMVQKVVVFSR